MYDRILVAVDGSPTADRALDEAIQLAQKLGSELVIAHVIDNSYLMYDVGYIDVGAFTEALVKQGNQIVADARAKAEKAGVHVHSVWLTTRSALSISALPLNRRHTTSAPKPWCWARTGVAASNGCSSAASPRALCAGAHCRCCSSARSRRKRRTRLPNR